MYSNFEAISNKRMIYIHKILPALLSAYTLFAFFIVVGLIKRKNIIIWIALLVFLVCSTPVVSSYLFSKLENTGSRKTPADMQSADAIVVLSGMTHSVNTKKGIISEWNDPDRFFGGIELIKANKAPILIFTRGKVPWKTGPAECDLLKEKAIEMGVDSNRIVITGEVSTTEDEAREVNKILSSKGKKIILVTSAFHIPRAIINFNGKGFDVQPYPVDFKVSEYKLTPMDFIPNSGALGGTEKSIREMIGRTYYWVKELL
jgi:uncharacterized SAM-binding protein YcdF (DUF218 family)